MSDQGDRAKLLLQFEQGVLRDFCKKFHRLACWHARAQRAIIRKIAGLNGPRSGGTTFRARVFSKRLHLDDRATIGAKVFRYCPAHG